MRLSKYSFIANLIVTDPYLRRSALQLTLFRNTDGSWHDMAGSQVLDRRLATRLDSSLRRNFSWRPTNSKTAYFPIAHLRAVLQAEFNTARWSAKLAEFDADLVLAIEHATNAYTASFDHLTGLPTRGTFERKARDLIGRFADKVPSPEADAGVPSQVQSASLCILDLDHFKQINDSYGHLYGDLVLRALARRIETEASHFNLGDGCAVLLARLGGEEFAALLMGDISEEKTYEFADRLRESVSKQPLPSDEEWMLLTGAGLTIGLTCPPIGERTVTTSVGMTTIVASAIGDDADAIPALLIRQADIALYKAKDAGRDATKRFQNILARHGAVLAYHQATGVVVIDLGRQVGAAEGQEFLVFHPDFGGGTAYSKSDGRTRRRMGTYPRKHMARIVVFEAQAEISFCKIEDPPEGLPLEPGSGLEIVPMGSFVHLLPANATRAFGMVRTIPNSEAVVASVGAILKSHSPLAVIVFSIAQVDELVTARGSMFVNQALATLYDAIRTVPAPARLVAQITETQFAAVLEPEQTADASAVAQRVVQKASSDLEGVVRFGAGLYTSQKPSGEPSAGDKSQLDPNRALDYARYAVAVAHYRRSPFVTFTAETARQGILHLRQSQLHDQVLADYERLTELGVAYAPVENLVALSAMTLKDAAVALSASSRAMALDPTQLVYAANHAYAQALFGSPAAAHETYEKAEALGRLPSFYRPYAALVGAIASRTNPPAVSKRAAMDKIAATLEDPAIGEEWRGLLREQSERLEKELAAEDEPRN